MRYNSKTKIMRLRRQTRRALARFRGKKAQTDESKIADCPAGGSTAVHRLW
jgi:hypothetical protein